MNSHSGWRRAALFLTGWTLLGPTFASLSSAIAVTDGRPYGAWRLFPKNISRSLLLWVSLSPFVFRLTAQVPRRPSPHGVRGAQRV